MAKAPKFYVVWQGKKPGVYNDWDSCRVAVEGVAGARYKAFPTRSQALKAFSEGPAAHIGARPVVPAVSPLRASLAGTPLPDALAVDAAWNSKTGDMEYQGIDLATGRLLFRMGPYADATNNIGEFLAIVHALALLQKQDSPLPIYSDSRTAIGWVHRRKANTKLAVTARNAEIFDLVKRAENWLHTHHFANKILKWETQVWGENPADFGRK